MTARPVACLQPATLTFAEDGTPFSETYGDVYHAAAGAIGQARHVFIGGNRLSERWPAHAEEAFTIVETGFGTGLNFLATWQAWQQLQQDQQSTQTGQGGGQTGFSRSNRLNRLHFLSVEKHPFTCDDLEILHRRWPELSGLAQLLREQWPTLLPGVHRLIFTGGQVVLTLAFGDGLASLKQWVAQADAFYLDGFSPSKNPDLWSQSVFSALARLAKPGATLATWSVAGEVRKGLQQAGFVCEKTAGYAEKREMLTGFYRPWVSKHSRSHGHSHNYYQPRIFGETASGEKCALIVGAGAAGTSVANRLAARGWQVTVFDAKDQAGEGASGNLAGIMRPHPSVDDNPLSRLTRASFLFARRHLQALAQSSKALRWQGCGVLHLARDAAHEQTLKNAVHALQAPEAFIQYLDQAAASRMTGRPLEHGCWYFPQGGWVSPPTLCRANLEHANIELKAQASIARIDYIDGAWQLWDADNRLLGRAPVLVMANGVGARAFAEMKPLPLRVARGEVSHLSAERLSWMPSQVLCGPAYIVPPVDGICCTGATFQLDNENPQRQREDTVENLEKLDQMLPGLAASVNPGEVGSRTGFRPVSLDRIPMIGPLPDFARIAESAERPTNLAGLPRLPGLYIANGFGTRGIVWSALAGELLACRINGEPLPLEKDLVEALDPGRFLLRRYR